MIITKDLRITNGTGSGWSNIPACYDKSDTTSAQVVSGQGQGLFLSVDTSNIGDVQNISSATLKITSSCWYVDNNFFDVTTNVSTSVIDKIHITTSKNTHSSDITDIIKTNKFNTLMLRPYATSPTYETTIELFEVRVEVIVDDGTGVNNLFLGQTSVNDVFFGNSKVISMYLGNTLVYGK